MVDEVRILRLLRSITDDISVLSHESGADESRREDPMWLRGVKYTFVTAIEACVDVAQHICATEGWGPPADNGDAVRLLGDRPTQGTRRPPRLCQPGGNLRHRRVSQHASSADSASKLTQSADSARKMTS